MADPLDHCPACDGPDGQATGSRPGPTVLRCPLCGRRMASKGEA